LRTRRSLKGGMLMLKKSTWVSQGPKVGAFTSLKVETFSIHLSSFRPSIMCSSPVCRPNSRELTSGMKRAVTFFRTGAPRKYLAWPASTTFWRGS
jgi:hypothetical protein